MRHKVSQQSYAKSIRVLSGFFRTCAILNKGRNRTDNVDPNTAYTESFM